MITRKHVLWLGGGFAVIYALQQPDGAAALLNSTASGISSAAGSIATFVNGLAS